MSNQDNNHGWVHYWLEWRALTRPDSIWLLHQTLQSMLHLVLNMRKYLPPHLQRLVPLNHDKCIGVDMSQEFKLFKCSFNRSFPNLTPRDEGMACIIGEGWAKDWRKGRRSNGESNPFSTDMLRGETTLRTFWDFFQWEVLVEIPPNLDIVISHIPYFWKI